MPHEYTPFDKGLAGAAYFQMNLDPDPIVFQFPPKILSDGRKGDWKEENIPGAEPVAVYQKSGPREITLTITYIVDGGEWTTDRISDTVKRIRGYFARTRDLGANQRALIVLAKFWNYGDPDHPMTFRIKGVDVKHSETLVTHCTNTNAKTTNYERAFPLRTDITIDLRLWTKGGTKEVQNFAGLELKEHPKWY